MPESTGEGNTSANREFIGALDVGTSSVRFLIYALPNFEKVAAHQIELQQFFPNPGWVEQDPDEILRKTYECIKAACEQFSTAKHGDCAQRIKAIGISNQRESTIVWDKYTGKALHRSIVWSDIRTVDTVNKLLETRIPDKTNRFHFQKTCGLPVATYFSGFKLRWILDNSDIARKAFETDALLFGTVDTWVVWNLTGGPKGGQHVTDCTNASRTFLMNIATCQWDDELLSFFDITRKILPEIKSSAEIFGSIVPTSKDVEALRGVPVAGILGDQQAALVGNRCFAAGQAKNTYGTGCFLLQNVGEQVIFSNFGMLSTVAYKFGPNAPTVYALEGSVAVVGSAIRWLRDQLCIVQHYDEIDALAATAGPDTQGVYFVPAFTGLLAPHWDSQARGMIIGLTQSSDASHIARAALEAGCYQTRELLDAMQQDLVKTSAGGEPLKQLIVDGGLTKSKLMMQFQADVLGADVCVKNDAEMTCKGVAYAAAYAVSLITLETLTASKHGETSTQGEADGNVVYHSKFSSEERLAKFSTWLEAVARCKQWAK